MSTTPRSNRQFALRANILLLRFSRNWLRVVIVILALYVSLPYVAPTLMRMGLRGPGELLYTLYSPFCHQFAFRSFFLYGEQYAYPRDVSGTDLQPFEVYAVQSPEFIEIYKDEYALRHGGVEPESVTAEDLRDFSPWLQFAARRFRGDEVMGYKNTLCGRDMAIYTGLLFGAIIFTRIRHRLRPVPLLLYAFLGLGPIAIDGFSQLLGYPPFNLWPPREALPIFRIITGALFGLMNAWLGLPYLEMSFQETREQLEEKLHNAGIQV